MKNFQGEMDQEVQLELWMTEMSHLTWLWLVRCVDCLHMSPGGVAWDWYKTWIWGFGILPVAMDVVLNQWKFEHRGEAVL